MINDEIRAILKLHGRIPADIDGLSDAANLFDAGLTSLASVDVVLALEATFAIEFPDHMMQRKTFESVSAMAEAIRLLRAAPPTG